MRARALEVLEELKEKSDRKQANFYISAALLKKFQRSCSGVPQSHVLERLMMDFVEAMTKETSKTK